MIESFHFEASPGERFRREALLHAGGERQVFLDFSLALFEKFIRGTQLFFGALLLRNICEADDGESAAIGIFHGSRTGNHRKLRTIFRGKEELVAYPAQRLNFAAPLANVGYFVWPVIDEERIVAQNFFARYTCHFLKDRIDE